IGSGAAHKAAIPQSAKLASAGEPEPEPRPRVQVRVPKKKRAPVITRKETPIKMESTPQDKQGQDPEEQPRLTAAGLHAQIAALSVEIAQANKQIAKRPRIKFINSVNAQKYKAAAYEKAFQEKVERIGNLNNPDQARREHLSGSLVLAVGVRSDGAIYRIEVRRSSGHQALDDGAIRIARLAAPYAQFPIELAMEADILVITRTWRFSDDTHVTTSR
ncbi:MAG: TonB family protein, partial [Methylococcales bacterium]